MEGSVGLADSPNSMWKVGKETTIFQKDGKLEYISNVYYVPNMKSNRLNIEQFAWIVVYNTNGE